MKNSIRLLLTEAKEKMNAYTVYMNYQFMNFSVKAEPAALLSVEVEIDDEKVYLENTADVAIPEDDQFAIIPKDQAFLFAISKAIAHAHPEYRQEQKELEQDEENADMPQSPESSEDTDKYLLCTMPEINKDRHDAGMDYVKMIYDEATGRLEAARVSCEVKMAAKLKDAQPKETDEANDELKKIYDQHKSMCDDYRQKKEKQIDDAYQHYLEKKAEEERAESERRAAHGENAGKQINLNSFLGEDE